MQSMSRSHNGGLVRVLARAYSNSMGQCKMHWLMLVLVLTCAGWLALMLMLMLMPALRETEKQRRRRESFRLMGCAETIELIEDMSRCSGFCPNNDELK